MSTNKKKTVFRSVRLTQELDSILRDDAEASNMSVNGLINRIMTKYVEWDRHTERFGFISFAKQTFRSILNEVDDSKVEQIATNTASLTLKTVTLFWFKKLNLKTLLKTISNYCKYSGLGTSEIEVNGALFTMTFHHDLGRKYSIYLKNAISQFVKTALGTVPETEATDDLVVIRFCTLPSNSKD
jgi:hypothetical protein